MARYGVSTTKKILRQIYGNSLLTTSTAASKSARSAVELIWSTLCNGWNAMSFVSSNLIFCRCLKQGLDLMLTDFCDDWSINNDRFEPFCNDRLFWATLYQPWSHPLMINFHLRRAPVSLARRLRLALTTRLTSASSDTAMSSAKDQIVWIINVKLIWLLQTNSNLLSRAASW